MIPVPAMNEISFIRRLSQFGTLLFTRLHGKEMGRDDFGNVYFRERSTPEGARQRRWVLYRGEPDPSKIPPEWHIWLHHNADAPLPAETRHAWQKPHVANMTGTTDAWMPPALAGERRPKASGDYQAWQPE